MARFDVLRSLVREAARKGSERLGTSDLGARLERMLAHAVAGRLGLDDAELTAAVARVPGIAAATVASEAGALHIDIALDDGRPVRMRFAPQAVKFAPAGAKELSFLVDPPEAAEDARVRDAFAAVAGAVARTLWKPALRATTTATSGPSAFVDRDGAVLVLDLRTVPEVRAALRTRLGAALIDTVTLRAVEVRDGGLMLRLGLPAGFR